MEFNTQFLDTHFSKRRKILSFYVKRESNRGLDCRSTASEQSATLPCVNLKLDSIIFSLELIHRKYQCCTSTYGRTSTHDSFFFVISRY